MTEKGVRRAKEAPTKTPQKQGWRAVFYILLALAWVFVSIAASQILVGNIMILILGREGASGTVPTAIYSALSYLLAVFLVVYVPRKVVIKWKIVNKAGERTVGKRRAERKEARTELGLKGLPTWTDIGLAPVGFIVYLLLAAGLVALFSFFSWFNAGEAQEVGFNLYLYGADRVVAFLTLAIIAPVAEEIIFRGWLYGKLREKTSGNMGNALSIILSSLLVSALFGAVHGQWNVGVNVFAMSLVACTLREVTGTIYAGILLHILKNGVAFYLLYIMGI